MVDRLKIKYVINRQTNHLRLLKTKKLITGKSMLLCFSYTTQEKNLKGTVKFG